MNDTDNDNLNSEPLSLLEEKDNLKNALKEPQADLNMADDFPHQISVELGKAGKKNNAEDMGKFEEMFKAGVHFGYSKSKRHSKMAFYIYGIKNNVEIFDLEKTEKCLESAAEFLKNMFQEKKTVLFVGTKPGISDIVKNAAEKTGMPFVVNRWVGGTITNFRIIRGRISNFEKLKKDIESDSLHKYTKKERIKINKEFEKMKNKFSGLELLTGLPDVLIVVDSKEENTAVLEAKKMNIPVVAIMSSDCDPRSITYLVPANDAAPKSVEFIINRLIGNYEKNVGKD